jgi:lipopolysaccharide heptosyltransferase II
VLCIRLDTIGDVLMTTPAIRALRTSAPRRRVTLLTSPAGEAVARLVPEIDDVILYDAPWMKATAPRADAAPDRAMAERLRAARFDVAAIFTVYSQSPLPAALLCWLADIPLRLAHCRENPYQLLTDPVPEPEPDRLLRHEVRRQLDLVATVGCRTREERLSLAVPERARRDTTRLLAGLGVDPARPLVAVHPGATAASRRYPPDGFAAAGRALARELGCELVFVGTASERELVDGIRSRLGAPSHSLVGAVDVAGLAAVLSLASVLVANNSGPVHVAAAVGTPVVDLYALTNPQHTPWGVPNRVLCHDVPCKYCYKSVCPEGHHDCLRLVPPAAIVRATADLLAETRERGTLGDAAAAAAS